MRMETAIEMHMIRMKSVEHFCTAHPCGNLVVIVSSRTCQEKGIFPMVFAMMRFKISDNCEFYGDNSMVLWPRAEVTIEKNTANL